MYSVYQLSSLEQDRLLNLFPPKYPKTYADHVTVQFGGRVVPLPSVPDSLEIIGRVDDNRGLEALVVRVNKDLRRSDGQIYHITWSLNPDMSPLPQIDSVGQGGYRPVHSNALVCGLIDTAGHLLPDRNPNWTFERFSEPVPFHADPKVKYTSSELAQKAQHTI